MGRIVKVILVHIAITMFIALVLPSSQSPPRPISSADLSSTIWDCQHNLLRPTYPPQDLQGKYLSPYSDQPTMVPMPSPESHQRSLVDDRGRSRKGAR